MKPVRCSRGLRSAHQTVNGRVAQRNSVRLWPNYPTSAPVECLRQQAKCVGLTLADRSGDVELAVSQAVVGTALGLMLPNLFVSDGAPR